VCRLRMSLGVTFPFLATAVVLPVAVLCHSLGAVTEKWFCAEAGHDTERRAQQAPGLA
jgi:hypothetical protein